MIIRVFLITCFYLFSFTIRADNNLKPISSTDLKHVALYERLGHVIPKEIIVYDSKGVKYKLGDLIKGRPTFITFNYFTCPVICSTQVSSLAQTLQDSDLILGKDYNMLTISIDFKDNKYDASIFKKKAMSVLTKNGNTNWKFLYVSDYRKIRKITNTLGFGFDRSKEKTNAGRYQYYHPTFMTVVSKDGKITRYLDGLNYTPMNIKLAIYEAIQGKIGATIAAKKALSYCFTPNGGGFVFDYIKVLLYTVLVVALIFLFYLIFISRKRKDGKRDVK